MLIQILNFCKQGRLILVLVGLLLAVWSFEKGTRLWLLYSGAPTNQVIPLLRPDTTLIWRQRENFSGWIWGKRIITDPHGFRTSTDLKHSDVIVLGPSSAFGWGVDESDTYASQIARRSKLRVANASEIGFTILQGERLVNNPIFSDARPKWIIVAYGINELDRFRFYDHGPPWDSDQSHLDADYQLGFGEKYLFYFFGYHALKNAFLQLQYPCALTHAPQVRVSEEEFLSAAKRLRVWASEKNANILFLGTALKPTRQPVQEVNTDQIFAASALSAASHDCRNATKLWQIARTHDGQRIRRSLIIQNALLRRWSATNGIPYVDPTEFLSNENDFIDAVHPSREGHIKIAENLIKILVPAPSLMKKMERPRQPSPTFNPRISHDTPFASQAGS